MVKTSSADKRRVTAGLAPSELFRVAREGVCGQCSGRAMLPARAPGSNAIYAAPLITWRLARRRG